MYFHKMELKVWVEGIQRVICGVTEATTCQDVVIALAHATGKTGRFTLVERWRDNERLLAPSEAPLRVLHKWGEYASDVQFILRHSDKDKKKAEHGSKRTDKFLHNFTPHQQERRSSGSGIKKSLTFSGAHTFFPPAKPSPKHVAPENSSLESLDEHMSYTSYSSKSSTSPYASLDKPRSQSSLASPAGPSGPNASPRAQTLRPSPQLSSRTSSTSSAGTPPGSLERRSRQSPALKQGSPHKHSQPQAAPMKTTQRPGLLDQVDTEAYDLEQALRGRKHPGCDSRKPAFGKVNGSLKEKELSQTKKVSQGVHSGQDDLLKLVKLQQERLSVQDSQLKILDSEIQYWETREQDFEKQYHTVQEETNRLTQTEKSLDSSLQELDLVSWVDKLEIEKQHEIMLQSELTLVRSQLANAESGLLAAKNKVHKLSREVEIDKRKQTKRDTDAKEQEIKILQEISELQKQINRKLMQHEDNQTSLDTFLAEVKSLESAILEKKAQIADCERELKDANLSSFITVPSTEWMMSPDGSTTNRPFHRLSPSRPGSARKLIHSPQLLKETVATTKNPHGLWV